MIQKQSVPMKSFLGWNDVRQRSDYLRTHFANRFTKQIQIKHRCSQTYFKAMAAWCWDAQCSSLGRSLVGGAIPTAQGSCCACKDSLQDKHWHYLILFGFLSVIENRSFVKAKWGKANFRKVGNAFDNKGKKTGNKGERIRSVGVDCQISILYDRGLQTFSVKRQIVSIFYMVGCSSLSQWLNSAIVVWKQPQTTHKQTGGAVFQ